MSRSRYPAPDMELFAAAMRDVAPLKRRRRVLRQRKQPARDAETVEVVKRPSHAPAKTAAATPAPRAAPATPNPGLDRATAQKLKRGKIAIGRKLDLHGMTERDAHAALDGFVRRCWESDVRALLIVTGKGRQGEGVLRRNLPRWLASGVNAPRVLSIAPAQAQHGGDGAYYVLLRKRRTT